VTLILKKEREKESLEKFEDGKPSVESKFSSDSGNGSYTTSCITFCAFINNDSRTPKLEESEELTCAPNGYARNRLHFRQSSRSRPSRAQRTVNYWLLTYHTLTPFPPDICYSRVMSDSEDFSAAAAGFRLLFEVLPPWDLRAVYFQQILDLPRGSGKRERESE